MSQVQQQAPIHDGLQIPAAVSNCFDASELRESLAIGGRPGLERLLRPCLNQSGVVRDDPMAAPRIGVLMQFGHALFDTAGWTARDVFDHLWRQVVKPA